MWIETEYGRVINSNSITVIDKAYISNSWHIVAYHIDNTCSNITKYKNEEDTVKGLQELFRELASGGNWLSYHPNHAKIVQERGSFP